jgi:hypothetical protein
MAECGRRIATAAPPPSSVMKSRRFDHLVGERQESRRDIKTNRPCRL